MFFTKPKADSGDRSAFGGFWFNPVPARFGAAQVTPDTALTLSAVYACVRVLTDSVSTLPFQMYRNKKNGGKTQIRKHWLYRLFAQRPNDYQNPMEFRSMMQGHLALRGNAFAYIEENGKGEVTALHPIHPDRVTIEVLTNVATGPNWRYKVKNQDGSDTMLSRAEMFHIKGLSPDAIIGYSPIALARKMLATGLAAQDYGVRFFDNDASPTSGWLEHPSNFRDKEQRTLFRDAWQDQQSGANRGKVAVLEYGIKYNPGPTISNADAQFIETKKLTRAEVASLFRVPPHMIGDLDRATFSNIEQQSIDFVTHALRPWLVCWEEAIKYSFLDPEDDDLCIRFPVIELMRGDMAARAAYINTGVMNGTLTRNEGRIMEDRDPLPGLDEPLQMVNMVTASQAEEEAQEEDEQETVDPPPKSTPSVPPKNAERLNALAVAAAERVARKEAREIVIALGERNWRGAVAVTFAKHVGFVQHALGVSAEVAGAYIEARDGDPLDALTPEADIYSAALSRLTKLALEGTV